MNAAIRAIVRTSLNKDISIIGFKNGYEGIIDNENVAFDKRSVGNIIQRGGSILHTSRSSRFLKKKYRQVAEDNLRALGIDGLIVIGGEGSSMGTIELSKNIKNQLYRGKKGCIIILAEGGFPDGGQALADLLKEHDILDLRVTTLGHIQRGGNPSSIDRILATELGVDAVISLMNGASNVVIAKPINTIKRIDFEEIIKTDVKVDMYLHDLIENIA